MAKLSGDWEEALRAEFSKPYYINLYRFVKEEYTNRLVFPHPDDLFNALHLTPLNSVRVLILGQDPYHEPGQAHGLCFSVKPGVDIPPSLVNIYKELHDDLGCFMPDNGHLTPWARQGVLLLNTVLSVRAHAAASHRGRGWETFTDEIIRAVNNLDHPVVCMLWGRHAQEKEPLLTNSSHLVLKAPHPSPLSAHRGFFGCKHFSRCNDFLVSQGESPIDWQIPMLNGN